MIDKIKENISKLKDPYTENKIEIDKLIIDVIYSEESNKAELKLNSLGSDDNKNKELQRNILKCLKTDLKIAGVRITYKEFVENKFKNTRVIAIISGKGGVGKSETTYNLACGLKGLGKSVGIIDADIYGYSIQKISNTYGKIKEENSKINPLISENNIEMISIQHFIEENQNEAVVWRAPIMNKMLSRFIKQVNFSNDLDYLLIDMPPGTGDAMLTVASEFSNLEAIVVTLPEPNSSHVALRAGKMAIDLKIKLLGVVENMSYVTIENKDYEIFGSGGAKQVSDTLNIKLLKKIPIFRDGVNKKQNYVELAKEISNGN